MLSQLRPALKYYFCCFTGSKAPYFQCRCVFFFYLFIFFNKCPVAALPCQMLHYFTCCIFFCVLGSALPLLQQIETKFFRIFDWDRLDETHLSPPSSSSFLARSRHDLPHMHLTVRTAYWGQKHRIARSSILTDFWNCNPWHYLLVRTVIYNWVIMRHCRSSSGLLDWSVDQTVQAWL